MKRKKEMALPQTQVGDEAYRMLFESAGDPIFVHDKDRIFDVNTKACELLGYTKDELLSMEPSSVDITEERANMPGRIARLKSRGTMVFETVHQRKDGTPVPVEVTAKQIFWNGKPAVMSICRDLTRKKRAENILLTTVLEWQTTFDSVRDAIFMLDSEFKILRCNKAATDMFGVHGKDILGKQCWEVVHGTSEPIPECPLVRMKETRKREVAVIRSGDRWLEVTVDPILDEEGDISGVIHIVSDITELKKKDMELNSSYERFKQILEGASEGILIADIKTKMIKYSNPSISGMLGYGAEELSKMSIQKIHPPADWPHVLSEFEAQGRQEKVFTTDIPCLCKDGRIIYADINATKIVMEGAECNVGFFRDVTERKMAVQELRDSRMLYQDIANNQVAGIYRICVKKSGSWSSADNPPYSYEFINDRYCELTGATREQHMADPTLTMKLVHPDDWAEWVEKNEVSDRTLKPFLWDGRLIVAGKVIWVHYESRPRELPNGDRVWTGIILDISERMAAEEKLKQSLSLLNATIESTTDGILVVDNDGKISYSNSRFARMWGISQKVMDSGDDEKAINHVLGQLKNPELFLNKIKYLYSHPDEDSFDVIEFKDGKIFERYSQPQRIGGVPVGRVWSFRDVTMSRKAAESLNSRDRQYKSLIETTNTGYVVIDMEGRVLDANQEYIRLAGKNELKEILGRKVTEWTAEHEKDKNSEAVRRCVKDGFIRNFEIDYIDSSGKTTPLEINATVMDFGEGPRILTLCRDIAERRKWLLELQRHREHLEELVEERTSKLVESEKNYRELVENTNSIILRMDNVGNITFLNEFASSFFGFNYEEIIGNNVVGTIVPSVNSNGDDLKEMILGIGRYPEKFRNNLNENMRKNGERVWIAWTNKPIFDKDGNVTEILCVGNDITDRVNAERELEKYRNRLEVLVEERTEELRKKEESLSKAQHIAHLGNWNRNILTGELEWSDETRQIFGLTDNEPVTFEKYMALVHQEDIEKLKKAQASMRAGAGAVQVEYRINRKDGEIRHVYQKCEKVFDGNGKLTSLDGIVMDITERRNAELALVESETRFQKIVEQSPMSMSIVGMDGTIEYINKKAVEIFGYSHKDIPNMDRWWAQAYPDEKYRNEVVSTYMGLVKEAIEGNHEIEGREYLVTCKNGALKNVFIFGVPVSNKIFVMFDDITERKRSEQALRDSEERFRTIFEKGPIGMATVNQKGFFIRVNSTFSRILGYSQEEFKKLSYKDITHPERLENDIVKVGQLMKGEIQIYQTEKRYICRNKDVLWGDLTLSAIRDGEGKFLYFLVMLEDVTERKKAEQALRENEEKFRTLFNNMTEGVALHEVIRNSTGIIVDYRILDVNPAYEKHTGLSLDCAKGALASCLYGAGTPPYLEEFTGVLETGKPYFFDTYFAPMKKYFSISIFSPGENLFATVFEDITDRKMIEERLRQSEKMEAIGQLAGGIAHDFNNQLMGIMGYAEILADRLDDEDMRKDAESILRSSRRAADLTKDLLSFARKGKYQAIPVNIHKVIEEVISLLSHSIDKRIEIKMELKASPALIMGDPTQLQNALLNLAINARDAMPKGGEIVFTTESMKIEETYFRDAFKKPISSRCLKVCVIDNGIGIDSEIIKHIFEPFFTTKEIGKGTGMGLASVYGMVTSHNGIIDVKSELGKGAVFTLYFPLLEEDMEEDESRASLTSSRKAVNILLVDDEEIVRDMVAKMLRSLGHKVSICSDGKEALEYYRQSWQKIDLVVMDMMMTKMNGKDSFIGMRSVNPNINAILISGYSIDGEVQSLLDSGMKGFLQKPFSTKELNKAIESALKNGK